MTTTARPFNNDATCWQAVLDHDPAADGAFYYAVRSTRIYCRPTCPSRRPARENVRFFATSDAAELEGFRPCKRCRPNDVNLRQQVVDHVRHLLETAEPTPTLNELASSVSLSPGHLQRIFKQAMGVSPSQYAKALKVERLKADLKKGGSVTDALYAAGYGSSRALYSSVDEDLGMTPGRYRDGGRGVTIAYTLSDSPLGRMMVAATNRGVCALRFGNDDELLRELRDEFSNASVHQDQEAVAPHVNAVLEHLSGGGADLNLPLDIKASDFQRRVWSALRQIPYGEKRSYSEIARTIGNATAVRAVARACASNPVALAVPCHRVVASDGRLSGYRWGIERKRALLEKEESLGRSK